MRTSVKFGVLLTITSGQALLAGCSHLPTRNTPPAQATAGGHLNTETQRSADEPSPIRPEIADHLPSNAVREFNSSPAPVTVQPVGFENGFWAGLQSPSDEVTLDSEPSAAIQEVMEPTLANDENSTFGNTTPTPISSNSTTPLPNASVLTLSDFEAIALANNPTIRELAATTQKAAGFRTQVGLKANPIVGYQGQQLADEGTDQHLLFVEQEFVTGGKLELNRRVLNEALRAQLQELEAQRLRVATDIRVKFFQTLAAQRQMEVIQEFQNVTNQGLKLAELRQDAGEGSRIDVLQAKVQKNEIDLDLQRARIRYEASWRELAALAGTPALPLGTIQGDLPEYDNLVDWDSLAVEIVSSSPEYGAAQTRIVQARTAIERHEVQPIPNVIVQMGAGVDNSTNSGMINVQVGAPIPVFNQNQGHIVAAKAEFCRAMMEAQRIENFIKARLANVSQDYESSLATVQQYASEILPSAQESLELAEEAYKAGETSFIQVLVARRTYFDSNLKLIIAQAELASARAKVDGYVLTGALEPVRDGSLDTGLRDLTFGQQ